MRISVALAQINVHVGNIAQNSKTIRNVQNDTKADIIIFPELSIVGYPAQDLLLRKEFVQEAMFAAKELAKETIGKPALLIGCPWQEGHTSSVFNSALLLQNGTIAHITHKHHLPNYGVFDEKRVFASFCELPSSFLFHHRRFGIQICEDLWHDDGTKALHQQQVEAIFSINASPFHIHKPDIRLHVAAERARLLGKPLLYVNMVGGQDEVVYDGGSFVIDGTGEPILLLPRFEESITVLPL